MLSFENFIKITKKFSDLQDIQICGFSFSKMHLKESFQTQGNRSFLKLISTDSKTIPV